MASAVPTIANVAEFSAINNEAFTATFIANLNNVFEYQTKDIPTIFNGRKAVLINKLRDELLVKVTTQLSEYANKTPVSSKRKSDTISDIIKLGHALARPQMPNELDTIFKTVVSEPLQNPELQLDHLEDSNTLISFVKQIRLDLDAARSEIRTLVGMNDILTSENASLKERLTVCEASLGVPDITAEERCVISQKSEGSSSDSSAMDTDDDTGNEPKKLHKKRKTRHIKEKSLEPQILPLKAVIPKNAQIVPLEATNNPAFAFIGNVNPVCSRESIHKYINEKVKLKIQLSDIQELPIKSRMRAFKVAIPSNDLRQLTSSDWPIGVKVEPYHISKRRTPARKAPLLQQPRGNNNPSHQWKFRKHHQTSSRRQNGYRQGNNPNWSNSDHYQPEYPQNYYQQSYW